MTAERDLQAWVANAMDDANAAADADEDADEFDGAEAGNDQGEPSADAGAFGFDPAQWAEHVAGLPDDEAQRVAEDEAYRNAVFAAWQAGDGASADESPDGTADATYTDGQIVRLVIAEQESWIEAGWRSAAHVIQHLQTCSDAEWREIAQDQGWPLHARPSGGTTFHASKALQSELLREGMESLIESDQARGRHW